MIPTATYRLQFHKGFTFADALRHADYFSRLGVSHIYSSPILTARAGSMHGYDVVDHARINPELGGETGFRALAAALQQHGLKILLDIVPNHMAVGAADNAWWLDVLKSGENSQYAQHFDIDWNAPGLEGKVLAPFLGEPFAAAWKKGDLKLVRDENGLAFVYFEHRFPIRSEDSAIEPSSLSPSDIDALHARQHYRLADWREADAHVNWRRFFDITSLAALRADRAEVFEDSHRKLLALYSEGLVDGFRVDHIDGLADPRAYCRKLAARMRALVPSQEPYILVEKILAADERLPDDWNIAGTTGYEFMNDVSALQHAKDSSELLGQTWAQCGSQDSFDTVERAARAEILKTKFVGQFEGVVRAFAACISIPSDMLAAGLRAIVLELRCYRGYATGEGDSPGPGAGVYAAAEEAARRYPGCAEAIAAIASMLETRSGELASVNAIRRFYHLTAPVAAKAVEDTAFYRYGRLISRNDVGFDPAEETLSVGEFHARSQRRARTHPHSMLTTATHDHKRGEDTRARLAVLSEIPDEWRSHAQRWFAKLGDRRGIADADLYFLLQTLVGCRPADGSRGRDFVDRVENWSMKHLREAKLRSSWAAPDEDYEDRLKGLIAEILADGALSGEIQAFVEDIGGAAAANSLVQTALRYLLPGVPDLYQGTEAGDFSMVDPDNRRPVDFAALAEMLEDSAPDNGSFAVRKFAAVREVLAFRTLHRQLFNEGSYVPVTVSGKRREHVIAFERRHGDSAALVVAQLHCASALVDNSLTASKEWWDDTALEDGAQAADIGSRAVGALLSGAPFFVALLR